MKYIFGLVFGVAVTLVTALPTNRLEFEHVMEDTEEMPEDVFRFQRFLEVYDTILMPPSMMHESQALDVDEDAHHLLNVPDQSLRKKRQAIDTVDVSSDFPSETNQQQSSPSSVYATDDESRGKVRAELNRIFSCYHRLRCGITRQQAEQDCKWLESSELYHQIMRVLGVRDYPKKPTYQRAQRRRHLPASTTTTASPGPVGPGGQQGFAADPMSDAAINPRHRNLRNGITHAVALPGQYLTADKYPPKNRRAYDSFFV